MTSPPLTSEDRGRLRSYFLNPRWGSGLSILFFGLAIADSSVGKALLLAGVCWLAGAFLMVSRKPSDGEVDALVLRDLESLAEKAIAALQPSEDELQAVPQAFLLPCHAAPRSAGSKAIPSRMGKDMHLRQSIRSVVSLVPLEDRLGIYSCRHDFLSNLTDQEAVSEHHYRSITSVNWEGAPTEPEGSAPRNRKASAEVQPGVQSFSLDLEGAQPIRVAVSAPAADRRLEQTVVALRALLRESR